MGNKEMSAAELERQCAEKGCLPAPRRQFFMSLRDLSFWFRSAKSDSRLAHLQREHGVQKAFDLLYGQNTDPWGYIVPRYRYQRLKYEKLLAMLPDQHYPRVLDMGCGLGVFSRMLSPHAGEVVGVELSAVAVAEAVRLSTRLPNVTFQQGDVLQMQTLGGAEEPGFDLIILADVLYYLSPLSAEVLKAVIESAAGLLNPNGILLLANHYFFEMDPQSRMVRRIHNTFERGSLFTLVREKRSPFFLASLLQKRLVPS